MEGGPPPAVPEQDTGFSQREAAAAVREEATAAHGGGAGGGKKKPHPLPPPSAGSDASGGAYATCLDRAYVQKELRWAKQYKKKVIVVYESEERRASHFDYGKAAAKYKNTEWEYILNIDAIPYQRDEDFAEAMVGKILSKAADVPAGLGSIEAAAPMNPPGWWDFFLSHAQATGGDQTQTTSLRLKARGQTVWYDNAMEDRSTAAMEEGVRSCRCLVLFLTSTPAAAGAAAAGSTGTLSASVPEPEPEMQAAGEESAEDVFVAFRESSAARAISLQAQLRIPHGGLPAELPKGVKVVVVLLPDAEAPLLKREGDPLRQLLATVFQPESQQIVVPVVDESFSVDHFDGLPDRIRALARQHLVVMSSDSPSCPEEAVRSIQDSIQHARTERLSATLRGYLDTVIKDTESFRDPCTQEEVSTETQCVPLRLITLQQWSDSMKAAYERSDASDLIIIRRRHGYGDTVGYADRLGRQGDDDEQDREADVHFAEAQQEATDADLMPGAVLLGPAACGKTTLLTRTACGQARDALCGYLGALVPYVIPVMQFSAWLIKCEQQQQEGSSLSLAPDAELVLEFIRHHECGGARSGLYAELEHLFRAGNLCLIFDGLDEAGKKLQQIATYIGMALGASRIGAAARVGPRGRRRQWVRLLFAAAGAAAVGAGGLLPNRSSGLALREAGVLLRNGGWGATLHAALSPFCLYAGPPPLATPACCGANWLALLELAVGTLVRAETAASPAWEKTPPQLYGPRHRTLTHGSMSRTAAWPRAKPT
eukprot:COSAG06_NODE_5712_length_3307_cov_113.406231_2_plen_770_part_00